MHMSHWEAWEKIAHAHKMQVISAGRTRAVFAVPFNIRKLRSPLASKVSWYCRSRSPTAPRSRALSIMASRAELESVPGVSTPDAATKDFIFQQTMYRIKDPKASLDFYTRVMGFRLLEKLDFPDSKFTLYFLGYHTAEQIPDDPKERVTWMFKQPATLELTHNWGTEDDPNFKAHNGNDKPQGYGHIGFHVPDVYKACERFEKLGVEFVKKPDGGSMKGLAFIKDPDGYWIEILNGENAKQFK